MIRKTIIFCSTITLCSLLFVFTYVNFIKRTKGFCLKKITSYHEYNSRWDTGPLTKEQAALISRVNGETFSYLGSGKECYAFVNKERDLVLKFFKQKHMKTHSYVNLIPFPLPPYLQAVHDEKINRRSHLRNQTFSSYLIAYQHFKERTGLLYLHLNQTKSLNCTVTLISKNGTPFQLDLNTMEFLIQRRAEKALDHFDTLVKQAKIKEAKLAIGSILDLIITRSKKGISDKDNNCERNIGFIDGRAALIDVGEFRLIPPSPPSREELQEATADLRAYLECHNPELVSFLEVQIQKRINE